jgi:hypothetical protein
VASIDATGAITETKNGPGHPDLLSLFMPTIAVRDDGLAAVGIGQRLFLRAPGGAFDVEEDGETTATPRVAVSDAGVLAVGVRTDSDFDPIAITARLNSQAFSVPVEPVLFATPHAEITPGPIRVLDGTALVSVHCIEGTCLGDVSGREFGILKGTNAIVLIPVSRGRQTLRVSLRIDEQERIHLTRRLDRGRRRCELPADSRTYGHRGGFQLGVVTRGSIGSSRRMTEVAVCKPGGRAHTLAGGPSIVTAGLHAGRAAVVRRAYYAKSGGPDLLVARVVNLRTDQRIDLRLPRQVGAATKLLPVEVLPVGQRTVVYTEQVPDGRVRVMANVDGVARVLDFADGIDARSLRVDGTTVTWNTGSAEL